MHDQERPRSLSKIPISNQEPESQQPSSVDLHVLRSESETPSSKRTPEADDRLPEPWIPESKLPKLPARYANSSFISFVRKILLTNPLFPRFYADVVLATAPNSNEAKILRPQYQKLVEKVNQKVNHMSQSKTCTHIKVTGVRCGSPSLYGEQFCYFHQHAHRGVRKPPQSRLHPIAIIEDEESIQASLMEVINALMRNTIDLKRAELILRALHIAVKNGRRAKFEGRSTQVVREIPEYAQPETKKVDIAENAPEPELDVPYTAMIPPPNYAEIEAERLHAAKAQEQRERQAAIRARLERAARGITIGHAQPEAQPTPPRTQANMETAAPSRPSGPAVPLRSAVNASSSRPTHTFKKEEASTPKQAPEHVSQTPNSDAPVQRKPVASTPVPQATASPKERKSAHGTSRR